MEKNHQEEAKLSDTLNPQPIQSFSMPHYTDKTGVLPYFWTLAQTCLGDANQKVSK
jgi:hypothetical protein